MLRHEHFEEICAAAGVGQATGEELVELEHHASECGRCKQAYFNYLNVAAQQFATAKQDPTISPKAIEECIDSELFIRRFQQRFRSRFHEASGGGCLPPESRPPYSSPHSR